MERSGLQIINQKRKCFEIQTVNFSIKPPLTWETLTNCSGVSCVEMYFIYLCCIYHLSVKSKGSPKQQGISQNFYHLLNAYPNIPRTVCRSCTYMLVFHLVITIVLHIQWCYSHFIDYKRKI